MKIVIIGGVATGMSAATRARRLDEKAEIVVFEKSGYVSYANCGLPYYLGDVIDRRDALLLQTPEKLQNRFNLDVRVNHEVTRIDKENRKVKVANLTNGEQFEESYDYLVISTGAAARSLEIPGHELAFNVRNIEDVDDLKPLVTKIGDAVILGAGFIGVEVAENLHHAGFRVTLVSSSSQILPSFDTEMVEPLQKLLVSKGINLVLKTKATKITQGYVDLSSGETVPAGLVINASGIKPAVDLAQEAGLKIGENGGIWVDHYHRTSDPNIYAGGDAVEKYNEITDRTSLIPLANLANQHGRVIADAIFGEISVASKSLGTAIIGAFGLALGVTGLTERSAKKQAIKHQVIHLHPNNHAGYYPDAKQISMKVLFDPESGRLLGAQATGEDGVDKRIDVIATAIKGAMTVSDLIGLELSYAPQFGSAKDAINQAGYVGDNVYSKRTGVVDWSQVETYQATGYQLIDVRTVAEHSQGNIPGSENIPVDNLRENLERLANKKVIVYCQVGQRGHTATQILKGHGIEVLNLDGGYKTWRTGTDAVSRKAGKQ